MDDAAKLEDAFRDFSPDAVIHFAGLKSVEESQEQPLTYYSTNLCSTLTLLRVMDKFGCRKIVFSSSATVYGTPRYLPCDEAHPCAPVNPYGRTKYFIECILKDWTQVDPQAQAISLRYFNPLGVHASGLIGDHMLELPHNLAPQIMHVADGKRAPLCVFGDDYDTRDGTGLRDYVHVVDLAQAHVAALSYLKTGASAFNIGTGTGATVLELLKMFERVVQRPIPYTITERRPGDVAASISDPRYAQKELNWHPKFDLFDMCSSSWAWYQSRSQFLNDNNPAIDQAIAEFRMRRFKLTL